MPHRRQRLFNEFQDLLVRLHGRSRDLLRPDGHGADGSPDLALAFECRDRDLDVGGVGEIVWVYEGRVGHGGAVDGDVASAKRGHERRRYGRVVLSVHRVLGRVVALIAQHAARGQEFEIRPVGGEGRVEGFLRRVSQLAAVLMGEFLPAEEFDPADGEGARVRRLVGCDGGQGGGGAVEPGAVGDDVDGVGCAPEDVVPEVLTDAREGFDEGDVKAFEGCFRADAGDHEELWGLEGAG